MKGRKLGGNTYCVTFWVSIRTIVVDHSLLHARNLLLLAPNDNDYTDDSNNNSNIDNSNSILLFDRCSLLLALRFSLSIILLI